MTKCPCCGTEVEAKKPILDLSGNVIAWGDKYERLTNREAEVLSVLVDAYPRYVETSDIYSRIVEHSDAVKPATAIHVFVHNIRMRLPRIGWTIKNQYGAGYRLERLQEVA